MICDVEGATVTTDRRPVVYTRKILMGVSLSPLLLSFLAPGLRLEDGIQNNAAPRAEE